jgi:hypothetical protein
LFVIILEEIPLKNISDGNCRFQWDLQVACISCDVIFLAIF